MQRYDTEHSLFLCPSWLCWAWYQCTHLESLSPSGKIFRFHCVSKGRLLEAHSVDIHVNAVFSGHHLVNGRMALLLTTLLCRGHSAGPKLERKGTRDCGKKSCLAWIWLLNRIQNKNKFLEWECISVVECLLVVFKVLDSIHIQREKEGERETHKHSYYKIWGDAGYLVLVSILECLKSNIKKLN